MAASSTQRFVYRTQSTKAPERKPNCFPESAAVVFENGAVCRRNALLHTALVHTGVSEDAASTTYLRVFVFSHRDSVSSMPYLRFNTEFGAQLTLSEAPISLAWRVSGGWNVTNSLLHRLQTDLHLCSIANRLRRVSAILR
eukprot:IDg13839t1